MRLGLAAVSVALAACQGGDPVNGLCGRIGPSGCLMDGREGTFTCDAHGYVEMMCASGERCAEGRCRPPACTPSLFFCDHDVAHVCDATGTIEAQTDCGAMHGRCVVGPTTASCVAQACTPLTTFCAADGSTVEKCAPDGQSSSTVQACDDPLGRGNRCVGGACHDRCALVEAGDRSTLGCRFVGAALAGGAPTVMVVNPQPDLYAQVTLTPPSGGSQTVTVSPSGSAILALAAAPAFADGGSVAARASSIVSTVPVYAWIYEASGDGLALHPEHALSTAYVIGALPAGPQQVVALATASATQVTVTAAGGPVYSGTLQRGEALTVSSTADLTGARVAASAPVAVEVYASGGAASMPGAETLGESFVVLRSAVAVARDAAVVTGSLAGTVTLAAGASLPLAAGQRVQSTAPLVVVDQSGGLELVPPVEQWRTAGFTPAGSATLLVGETQPGLVDVGATTIVVVAGAGGAFASGSTTLTAAVPLSASSPFFALVTDGKSSTVPAGYGLASIHP